jgi:hypothetical protein
MVGSTENRSRDVRRLTPLAALAIIAVCAGDGAHAAQIFSSRYSDTATIAGCRSEYTGQRFVNCTSEAYLRPLAITGGNAQYRAAFDAWNATLEADEKWTLADGGHTENGNFSIGADDLYALAWQTVGGMFLRVDWSGGGHYWTQGLSVNYVIGQGIQPASFFEMDNAESTSSPLYPFQYNDVHFEDKPRGPWPNASFDAYAFLSDLDFETRRLTIYEGVNYGFRLSAQPVPEPQAWALMLLGFASLAVTLRRHRRRRRQSWDSFDSAIPSGASGTSRR